MKRGKIFFLKMAVVVIGIIVVFLCIYWLPWLAKATAEMNPEYTQLRYPVLVGIYSTTIPFYFALAQTLKLLNLIKSKNAFSQLAIDLLKNINHCGVVIISQYVLGLFFIGFYNALHPGIAIMGVVIILAALTISLFAAVLQELLRNVLAIKSENDLTV